MSFRATAVLLLLWPALLVAGRPDELRDRLLAELFSPVPARQQLRLDDGQAARAAQIRNGRYRGTAVPFWRADGRSVWVLKTRAKTGWIQAAFAVQDGRVLRSEVLDFKEERGRQICSERFLRQFAGASLLADGRLDREIDGITGATLTVRAMRDMARLALFYDSLVPVNGP